jgi:hypothetical protein
VQNTALVQTTNADVGFRADRGTLVERENSQVPSKRRRLLDTERRSVMPKFGVNVLKPVLTRGEAHCRAIAKKMDI